MELFFTTSAQLQKLVILYSALQHPKAQTLDIDYLLKGTKITKQRLESYFCIGSGPATEIFRAAILKSHKYMPDDIDPVLKKINLGRPNQYKFRTIRKKLLREQEHYKKTVKNIINGVFGFNMPHRVNVLLYEGMQTKSGFIGETASMLIYDPITVSMNARALSVSATPPISLLVHEILHAMIYKKKLINYNKHGSGFFEEALIRYFTPEFIFDEKTKTDKIDKSLIYGIYKDMSNHLNGVRPVSKRLLPIIIKYYKDFGKYKVWDLLATDKEFKRLLNIKS